MKRAWLVAGVVAASCAGLAAEITVKPAGVKFVDEDGNEQEANRGGRSRMSFGKIVNIEISYKAKKKRSKGKLVVEYWKDLEKVSVPVEMKLGLAGAGQGG